MNQNQEQGKLMDETKTAKPQSSFESSSNNNNNKQAAQGASDYANDVAPPPYNSDTVFSTGPQQQHQHQSAPVPGGTTAAAASTMPPQSNPYVSPAPVEPSKNKMDAVKDVLWRWGQKAAETTKKAEDLAGNMWQHLKTGPSFADAAVGRIAQGTKVLTEGGYEKIFQTTFDTVPEEKLQKTYACYLSTSAGPVMGVLYLSTVKLAFCSDNPLSYKAGDQTQWSYYKVVIPLSQLKAVHPSISKAKTTEKYIQVISVDNHEFWFMGFLYYDSAIKSLQAVVPRGSL